MTNQSVAVKRYAASEEGARARERCDNEIELMTNIVNCDNIVKAIKVEPASFLAELQGQSKTALPVLCLEYCEGGGEIISNKHKMTSATIMFISFDYF